MGLRRDWALRYAEVKPFVRILFPFLLLYALLMAFLGGYGAMDYLRSLFPIGAISAILFATGAISGERVTRRFDFSLSLPYSRPSFLYSKFIHRFFWLCFTFFVPFALAFLLERFFHESPDLWQLPPTFLLFLVWTLLFYGLTFLLSILSAYPLQEMGRMMIYAFPIYLLVPVVFAPYIAIQFLWVSREVKDFTILRLMGIALVTFSLLILTGLLFAWVARVFLKKDWGA